MASLAQINVRFKVDMKGFSTEMQNAMRTMQQVGTRMNALGKSMSLYVTAPLLAAGGAAIKFASDYNESLNKVDVAFGPASDSVKSFAKDSLTSFGLAEGSALDAAAQYGDMATSMGITQIASAKMSTSLVGLAGDLASFKNIGIDQANTALAGVFTGETESLKKLGIVMTEANLQQFALSKGIKVQIKDMDQASKVNLRYAYIMANTTNAQGDFQRTGGGAANQMRIFQESLKQLAQQFGSVILPAFTKVIVYVNGLIKGFSELSPAAKTLIVGIAGIAAAIGPLMVGLGNVIGIIPRIIVQFQALRAVMIANPYTAVAIGIGVLALAVYAFVSSNKEAVSSQTALNEAVKKGNENAAAEVGTLDKLYTSATSVNVPIKERKKNVDDLQALFPAYFGNLKDEIILNGKATDAYNELRDAIFNRARATAIDGELQNRANERIATEIELREDIAKTEAEIERIRKGANVIVLQEANAAEKTARITITKNDAIAAQTKLLGIQNANLKKFNEDNLKADAVLFSAKEEYLKKTGKLEENEAEKLKNIKIGIEGIKSAIDELKPGTIAFYESQITGLQKLQKEQAITNSAWLAYQDNIDKIQNKIDALQNKGIKLPKPEVDLSDPEAPPAFALKDLNEQKAYYEALREMYSTNSDEYKKFTELINNTQIKINAIEGVENLTDLEQKTTASSHALKELSTTLENTVKDAVAGFAVNIADSVGKAVRGMDSIGGVFKGLLGMLAGFMRSFGEAMIKAGVAGIALKTTFKNPYLTLASGFLLVAFSAAMQNAQSAGSFANGGMVGGTSFSGDRLFARVNSGEMILNQRQQRNLSNMINPAVTAGDVAVQLMGGIEIEGSKLLVILKRAEASNNRTS